MGLPGVGLLLKLISFLLASFILIHLFALFGVFIVLAYPIWWLLAPKSTTCFYCRVAEEGNHCPFCEKPVDKKNGVHPENFISAVLNGVVILIFSIFSVGFVVVEAKLLFDSGMFFADKTATFLVSSKNEYYLDQVVPMRIELDNIPRSINTIRADLGFDPTMLEVSEISTADSFASIFIEKEINNQAGYVRLTGGVPNPGNPGPRVLLGTVLFKPKKPGLAEVRYLPSSLALANDGRGTNLLKDLSVASFLILPEGTPKEKQDREEVTELQSLVLGDTNEKVGKAETQIFLLPDENGLAANNKVLGAETDLINVREESLIVKILKFPLELLRHWDEMVLSFWRNIIPIK